MEPTYQPIAPEATQAADYDRRARALSEQLACAPIISHAYGPQAQQLLEVYRPAQVPQREKLPVLVFLHGGAWIAGGLEWSRFMAPAATELGVALVIASYRLAPEHRWPAQLNDTVTITQWVQAACGEFGGDPSRIVLAGHSAGGHLAAMAVLSRRIQPVLACMPVSGPMDLRYGRIASDTGAGRVYQYLLSTPNDDTSASPICTLEHNTTPFHLTWGEHDFERVIHSNQRMATAMQDAKQSVHTAITAGASHFDTHLMLADASCPWYATLRSVLGE